MQLRELGQHHDPEFLVHFDVSAGHFVADKAQPPPGDGTPVRFVPREISSTRAASSEAVASWMMRICEMRNKLWEKCILNVFLFVMFEAGYFLGDLLYWGWWQRSWSPEERSMMRGQPFSHNSSRGFTHSTAILLLSMYAKQETQLHYECSDKKYNQCWKSYRDS